jgi:hypothetical protein
LSSWLPVPITRSNAIDESKSSSFSGNKEILKMGLFDDYFDPQQFGDGGGLFGRLLSLQQQQGQYQPTEGSTWPSPSTQLAQASSTNGPLDATASATPQMPASLPMPAPTNNGQAAVAQTPDYGPTSYIPVGNYLMPQFGSTGVPQPMPGLGDRLSAGLQSWAHTPVGNPFAALANGLAGFNTGQHTDQRPPQQNSKSQNEAPQPPAGVQDAMLAPINPQTANKPAVRVLTGRNMARPNSWSSRYGR